MVDEDIDFDDSILEDFDDFDDQSHLYHETDSFYFQVYFCPAGRLKLAFRASSKTNMTKKMKIWRPMSKNTMTRSNLR